MCIFIKLVYSKVCVCVSDLDALWTYLIHDILPEFSHKCDFFCMDITINIPGTPGFLDIFSSSVW